MSADDRTAVGSPGRTIRVIRRAKALRETPGTRVKRLRTSLGWMQEDLAFEAEVFQSTVSLLEQDKHTPLADTLERIAGALGVSMAYLWTGRAECRHDEEAEAAS